MRIEKKHLSELNRAAYNPRVDLQPGDEEYESIRYSLERYGLVQPIVWNERTGNVVSGHQRLTVLQNQGVEEIEVSVVSLDDTAEKQLNIALNKTEGSWDNDKLTALLVDLGDDAINTGFTQEEIEVLQNEISSFFDDEAADEHEEQLRQQDEDYFCLTLTFDEADKEAVQSYIKEHGEEPVVRIILQKAKGEI